MMLRLVLSIVALFLSLGLLVVGNGMLGTLLAVRLQIEGVDTRVAGLVLALYSVGFVLGSLYGFRVIRRVGHVRSFTTFGAVATAAILLHPLMISVVLWMALRLIVGFCIAGLMLVTESWVNARATSETRGTLLSTYMVLFFLAASGGQFLLAAGDPGLHHLFNLAAILVALSLVPLSLTSAPAPELTEGERLVLDDWQLPGSKLTLFCDTLDELLANQHRVLVFSQFVDHLAILRDELNRKEISYQYLDGSTPARQRNQRVEAFQAGEGSVFLISLKAGGLGLNLTAADYVIHMDPWWNPAVEDQASDRAHRLGQKRPVTIYRLITRGTIEERIAGLHAAKRDLADSLLEGTDLTGKLSAEELLQLIRE